MLAGAADVVRLAALRGTSLTGDGDGVIAQARYRLRHADHALLHEVEGVAPVLDDVHHLGLGLLQDFAGVGVEDGLDEVGAVAHPPVGQRAGVSRQLDGGDDGVALTDSGLDGQ